MLLFLTPLLALFLNIAQAEDNQQIDIQKKLSDMRIMIVADYMTVSNPDSGSSFSGPGVDLQLLKSLNEKYAIGGSIRQTFSLGGQSGSITNLSIRITKAITGKIFQEEAKTKLNGMNSVKVTQKHTSGWRAQVLASQYFFNTSYTSVPYTGFGLVGYYEKTTNKNYDYVYGLRVDHVTNTNSLNPISAFWGISFWLN